ncbi:hypothetical protein HDU97_000687 [Phlyctochytrium planicorne]|nr:hypothetical protein HDU97_000687 [Phlyctochytrium planicorne]
MADHVASSTIRRPVSDGLDTSPSPLSLGDDIESDATSLGQDQQPKQSSYFLDSPSHNPFPITSSNNGVTFPLIRKQSLMGSDAAKTPEKFPEDVASTMVGRKSNERKNPPTALAAEQIAGSRPRPRTAKIRSQPSESSKKSAVRAKSAPASKEPEQPAPQSQPQLQPPNIQRPQTGKDGDNGQISVLPPPAPGTAHRRYSSVYPCANRLLAKRWDDAARERHRQKLATIKAYIDNAPPKRHGHLQLRLKKLQLEDENLGKIERENLILLDRMSRQMSAPQGFSGIDPNYKLRKVLQKPPASERKKKEEQQQIEQANLMLMQRVEAREPHYHQELWDEERRTNLGYFQRISRFPEGYQHILDREGVPPPLKGKLPIRMNRSELLRKSWYSKTLTEQNAYENGEESERHGHTVNDMPATHSPGEINYPKDVKVHQTKTDKLRQQFIQAMSQGAEGRKKWYQEHGTSTSDPLDVASACARSAASSARASPDRSGSPLRARSQSPSRKLPVRENRAQRLRLEEKKKATPTPESLWHPAHLGNIEARIDFGQGGWSSGGYKGKGNGEQDREALISNFAVDEAEYEPEVQVDSDASADFMHDERTWDSVLMGIALRDGCKLPLSYPSSILIYWSSEAENRPMEYEHIVNNLVKGVKEVADLTGVEFIIRDLKWGSNRYITDSQRFIPTCLNLLDSYLSKSVGLHFIITVSNKIGSIGFLPVELLETVFDSLLVTLEEDGDEMGKSLLQKWYRLDTNALPNKYVLQNISSILPDYVFAADPKVIAEVDYIWE